MVEVYGAGSGFKEEKPVWGMRAVEGRFLRMTSGLRSRGQKKLDVRDRTQGRQSPGWGLPDV